jgi:hypothetical protein
MNTEIGTEATQFPEKKHINGIFVAVYFSFASTYRGMICALVALYPRRVVFSAHAPHPYRRLFSTLALHPRRGMFSALAVYIHVE